jgi:alpha-ribazole phosphatase
MTPSPFAALLLIRHGEPAAWAQKVCHGTLDVPLSDEGVNQARRVADHLRDARLEAVYASPLDRAVATASVVAGSHGLAPVLREDLAEIDFGAFEGRPFDEIAASHPDEYAQWMREPASIRFPGGESFDDLRGRAVSEVTRIRREHESGSVAVVTHGGVIRAVLAEVLGVESGMIFRIGQSWGGLSLVEWVGEEPIVRYVNHTV